MCCVGLAARAQTTIIDSFQCDGVSRSYRLYVPANYVASAQHPLILNMHGLGSDATQQQYYSYFMPIADTAQFLMVYPQGLTAQGFTYWNCGIPLTPPTNDVKFLSALIDTMAKRYTVDLHRVYATGLSMGGYMSYYLALHLPGRITAIASVAGSMDPAIYPPAAPTRGIPVMQVHGTADGTVPYNGYANGIHIDTLVQYWVRANGCTATPVQTAVPDVNTTDGCTATHYVWSGGTAGATVELYKVTGGGHTWPGAVNIGLPTDQDFSASAEIWRFFRGYRLNQFLAVEQVDATPVKALSWPNPCGDVLHLQEKAAVTLTDMNGKVVLRQSVPATDIPVRNLAPGVYMLRADGGSAAVKIVKE